MKRITSWLVSPALALLIMATSPFAMAGGKNFSRNAGQFRGNQSSNNVSQNFQLNSGIKGTHLGQNTVQTGKPFNPGGQWHVHQEPRTDPADSATEYRGENPESQVQWSD